MHLLHRLAIDCHFRGSRAYGPGIQQIMERVWTCARCRDRYDRQLLLERSLPDGPQRRDQRLWEAIVASAIAPAAPASGASGFRSWRSRGGAAVLIAGLAATILIARPPAHPRSGPREPVPRGSLAAPQVLPTFYLYRAVRAHQTEPVTDRIGRADGVLVAYSNPSADLDYLLLFAVDGRGEIYWYYPAYDRLGDDPTAIPIRTQARGVELGEEVRHTFQPGELRMFGLFLPRPRGVLEIEDLVHRQLAALGGDVRALSRIDIPEGEQASFLIEVTP
jgi:hypothetical protein